MIDGHTSRTHFYVSMQQPGIVCAVNVLPNDSLEVQGQRVRPQPDSFWSYYPGEVGVFCKVYMCAAFIIKKFYFYIFSNCIYIYIFFYRDQLVGILNYPE
jgi:hypothetical protein